MPSSDLSIVVDFANFAHRAALARSGMKQGEDLLTSDGRISGHIFRAFTMLRSLKKEHGGRFVFAFEGINNFRYKIYPEYKANRTHELLVKTAAAPDGTPGPIPEDFDPIPDLLALLAGLKCTLLTPDGGEADDAIATYVTHTKGRHVIVSTDRDLYYLLKHSNVEIQSWDRKMVSKDNVRDAFNCPPSRVPFVKAIFGDSGDNILKVPRFGPVRLKDDNLQRVIRKAKTIDQLLAGVQKSKKLDPKIKVAIEEYEDQVRLMYRVAKLKTDVSIKSAELKGDPDKIRKLLKSFECKSLMPDATYLAT